MCLTSGEHGAQASDIFNAVNEEFARDDLCWEQCVAMSVDNASTMVVIHNSVVSGLLSKHEVFYKRPCHLAHIAASHANEAFSKTIGFDSEDLCVDLYYFSSKRKR